MRAPGYVTAFLPTPSAAASTMFRSKPDSLAAVFSGVRTRCRTDPSEPPPWSSARRSCHRSTPFTRKTMQHRRFVPADCPTGARAYRSGHITQQTRDEDAIPVRRLHSPARASCMVALLDQTRRGPDPMRGGSTHGIQARIRRPAPRRAASSAQKSSPGPVHAPDRGCSRFRAHSRRANRTPYRVVQDSKLRRVRRSPMSRIRAPRARIRGRVSRCRVEARSAARRANRTPYRAVLDSKLRRSRRSPMSRIRAPRGRISRCRGEARARGRCAKRTDPLLLPNRTAGDGTRTRDIQLGKLTLYQLSYTREGAPV